MKKGNKYTAKSNELSGIGSRIRKKRKSLGWTMMDLSFETEIDYRQIGRIERGETNFTVLTLLRIVQVLGINLKDIVK